jgi:formate hydrogenlyase subunit 6/NADH:ubiquinone oxidoreductase subunit I
MSKRSSRSYLVPYVLRRLFWPRETIAYPNGPIHLPGAYRGKVTLYIERCIGCMACQRACPADALAVTRLEGRGVSVKLRHDRCANCGLCVESCRRGAIQLVSDYEQAQPHKAALEESWHREGPPTEK